MPCQVCFGFFCADHVQLRIQLHEIVSCGQCTWGTRESYLRCSVSCDNLPHQWTCFIELYSPQNSYESGRGKQANTSYGSPWYGATLRRYCLIQLRSFSHYQGIQKVERNCLETLLTCNSANPVSLILFKQYAWRLSHESWEKWMTRSGQRKAYFCRKFGSYHRWECPPLGAQQHPLLRKTNIGSNVTRVCCISFIT